MRKPTLALAVLSLLLLTSWTVGAPAVQEQEGGKDESEEPVVETPLVIPESEKNRTNPFKGSAPSIENGETLFLTQCTMCHGSRGDGKGDLVSRLKLAMPDFTDPEIQKKRTDGELFFILTNGHGEMPGEGARMSQNWRWDLVNYIRTLSRPGAANPRPNKQ